MPPTHWLFATLLLVAVCPAKGAHTHPEVLLNAETVRPGDTATAGVRLKMDPGWHTYWRSPGSSGIATSIKWELPQGLSAGEPLWPLPEKLVEQEVTTFIYKDEVVLLVPIKVDANAKPGKLDFKAKVSWLECEVQCVPGDGEIRGVLTVGSETKPSNQAPIIEKWRKLVPERSGGNLEAHASWESSGTSDTRPLFVEWKSSTAASEADFFADSNDDFEVQGRIERLPSDPGTIRIRKFVKKFSGDWPAKIKGVIVQGKAPAPMTWEVSLPIGTGTGVVGTAGPLLKKGEAGTVPAPSLWKMLLYALIGGLILNIMPCVLPVIALKILGFVNQAKDGPGQIRKLGIVYSAGVLVSFLILAGLVIGVKAAGHKAGWGMQFGNPQFLVLLTVLVTLVALNLFGLFEVTASGRVMGAAGSLASKHGTAGAFFNGVLATILATPCTAPFLGAALGFAFAQSAPIIVLMFLTVGLGLALPYLVLSFQPAWLKFLPKPGTWMVKFKIAMGFPMLATAIWLFSLIPVHYGERSWWLGIFLVIIAMAAWVFGQFFQLGHSRRGLGLSVAAALVILGYFAVLEGQLRWRAPDESTASSMTLIPNNGGVPWKIWSPEAVASARSEGKPVLVDFTAKWCLTCNTIVKPALESSSVKKKLLELNAVALLGDYTRFPPSITDELNRFQRAGVPLVLVYPRNASQEPIVLPEAVTPSMVVSALERAAL